MFSGITIEFDKIVDFLKRETQLQAVCRQMVCQDIINQAAQARGVAVSAEEIQQEADRQRYERRLESAAETHSWLSQQLITAQDWEAGIRLQLLTHKLTEHLFGPEVEKYFVEHRLDFEQISLYRVCVPYQQLSQELLYQIEEGEISFYEAAHLYDIDETRRLQCGYEGKLYRWSLPPEVAAVVFSARIGEIIGPLENQKNYDLLMMEEFINAELNPETRQEILDRLFKDWLESEFNHFLYNGNHLS